MIHPCPCPAPSANALGRAHVEGFSLIELLCALAVIAVLAFIAVPSYQHHVSAARRAEARVAMAHLQHAQERWRAERPRYASMAELGLPARSGGEHYDIAVLATSNSGYTAIASARGTQARDEGCRHLQVTVQGGQPAWASGPTPAMGNDSSANRRCWQG